MVETAFPEAYANLGITPIAYNPGPEQGGFFTFMEKKAETDPGYREVMDAVILDMNNPLKSGTAFIDPWSAKAGDVQKAIWNPMLNGKKPVDEAVQEYIDKVNALANALGPGRGRRRQRVWSTVPDAPMTTRCPRPSVR